MIIEDDLQEVMFGYEEYLKTKEEMEAEIQYNDPDGEVRKILNESQNAKNQQLRLETLRIASQVAIATGKDAEKVLVIANDFLKFVTETQEK